jgi:hypothetical protein
LILIAKRALKIGLAVLLTVMVAGAVLLYPYEISGVPEWQIRILDSTGKPMVGVPVSEGWLDPIDEGNASGDQQETDATGTVVFQKRILHSRLEFKFRGAKASARIQVCAKDEYGAVYWDGAEGLPRTLTLQRGSCPYD